MYWFHYQLTSFSQIHHSCRLTTTPNRVSSMLRHVIDLYMDGSGHQRIPSQNRNRTQIRRQIPNLSQILYAVRREHHHWCSLRQLRNWRVTLLELLHWPPVQVSLSLLLSLPLLCTICVGNFNWYAYHVSLEHYAGLHNRCVWGAQQSISVTILILCRMSKDWRFLSNWLTTMDLLLPSFACLPLGLL